MRILIVEDDIITQSLLNIQLKNFGETEVAVDGVEAINAFKKSLEQKKPFTVIFLDIMMPNVDGHKVLKTIRELEKDAGNDGSKGVKIIMCSALDDSTNVIQAFRNQCEGYLTKPVTKENIVKQLNLLELID